MHLYRVLLIVVSFTVTVKVSLPLPMAAGGMVCAIHVYEYGFDPFATTKNFAVPLTAAV